MFTSRISSIVTARGALTLGAFFAIAWSQATPAHAQKKLDWDATGSISASLITELGVSPDVYSFEASCGEEFVFHTSLTSLDTTIRIVGPDAAIELFNDDRNFPDLTSFVRFVAPVAGTYLVIVSNFAGTGSGGNYALNFERQHSADPSFCDRTRSVASAKPGKS